MNIEPIARFHSPLTSKFGIPRQAGIVGELRGQIVFEPKYRNVDSLRGLELFDYLWIIWGFSDNVTQSNLLKEGGFKATVRPPLLGGNERRGVWATRSPFRPNSLGLSSVRIEKIEWNTKDGAVINVLGADLMDGTPIYDLKPYLEYVDSHAGVRSGFVDEHKWQQLEVVAPDNLLTMFKPDERQALLAILAQDPRPQFHDDAERIYGMPFAGYDVKFKVAGDRLTVVVVEPVAP